MADDASPASPAKVTGLAIKLLLPLQLHPCGDLAKARRGGIDKPSKWLGKYAEFLKADGKTWRIVEDPLATDFGVRPKEKAAEEEIAKQERQPNQFAEFVYFHPFVQRILYSPDADQRSSLLLVRDDISHLEIDLHHRRWRLDVDRVQMFLFATDLAVVAVHLHLPFAEGETLPIPPVLDLLNTVRRVYPPFYKEGLADDPGQSPCAARWVRKEGEPLEGSFTDQSALVDEIFKHHRPPLTKHWSQLLEPMVAADEASISDPERSVYLKTALHFRQLGDERAHTMAWVAVDDPALVTPIEHERLAYLDESGSDWPSAPSFLAKAAPDVFYDRYWQPDKGWTSRYSISSYSFMMLSKSPSFLRSHFDRHYFLLNLLAVMQKSSLLIAWDRLSIVLNQYVKKPSNRSSRETLHQAHKWFAEDFAQYTSVFEFSEVSSQIQAIELFGMLRRNMRCEKLYDEIKRQFEYMRDVETQNFEEYFTRLANTLGPIFLALAILGVQNFDNDFFGDRPFSLPDVPLTLRHGFRLLVMMGFGFLIYRFVPELVNWLGGKGRRKGSTPSNR